MAFLEKRLGKFRQNLKKKKGFRSVSDRRKEIENEVLNQEGDLKDDIDNGELDSASCREINMINRI